jgi:hypothetical protein
VAWEPEIWPFDPYQEKYNFKSITRVPTIRIGHMMARLKGLSVKIILSEDSWSSAPVAYSQSGQSPKIQIYGMMKNFMLMLKKPMDPNLKPPCSMGSMAMIRPKSKNTSMAWCCSFDQKMDTEQDPTNNFSFCQLTNNQNMCSLFPGKQGISYLFCLIFYLPHMEFEGSIGFMG